MKTYPIMRFVISAAILCALSLGALGQNPDSIQTAASPDTLPDYTTWIGEQIVFHVAFGIIPAGKARLAVVDTATVNGQLCVRAVSSARSAKSFDLVFTVRDSIETWFDADSLYSMKFRKKLREGRFRDEKIVDFDLEDSLAHWSDDGKQKPSVHVLPRVQDVLSAGFKARTIPMSVGDTVWIKTHDVKKTFDLMVIIHGRETVETPAGKFDCFKTEPVSKTGGLFQKEKSAHVYVWVTADERRIPVQMQTRVSFGHITAALESYTPPLSKSWKP
ncbi:DUF3108 domain-containing protein [candidate division KSB1 bacterium]|nr:MAG: DUF3108 domain-containing protein [candidate division KSB1 bacterium]